MREKGIFISFEGPDGAGKTSVLQIILQRLKPIFGENLLITREPGGADNPIAEQIRNLVLSSNYSDIDLRTEVLLFAAARRQHLVQTIIPALENGKLVISDRYVDSSVAYQGGGREIGVQKVLDVNQFATEGILPDKTIYFNIRPEIGIQRINSTRTNEINRLDTDTIDFHKRVNKTYLELADDNKRRYEIVNAEANLEKVVEETWQLVKKIIDI
ncbi:dTMP kinase [Leuconostoc gasicomitatum]|uniref:dTMP kinase n=1 Tax=Leuconostoc gasicomitatum TaxID=115778 RepID=UPI0007448DD8|nr:dTMP kinase [Leuconostoc gasicomitatum]CUR63292.1 Thymidylate kinase tmk [Leuconostoc gasicomitatum KG16-1]